MKVKQRLHVKGLDSLQAHKSFIDETSFAESVKCKHLTLVGDQFFILETTFNNNEENKETLDTRGSC